MTESWLRENQGLRMDALHPLYNRARRLFHLDRYVFAAERVRGLSVLDAACGLGYGSAILRLAGARSVDGVDADEKTIEYARATYGERQSGLVFHKGDLAAHCSEIPGTFGAAVSFETVEHMENDRSFLAALTAAVKPGGLVIVSTPNDWPCTEHHLQTYNHDAITKLVGEYFTVEECWNQNSGCGGGYNHDQPRGIVPTTPENRKLAECFVLVCRRR